MYIPMHLVNCIAGTYQTSQRQKKLPQEVLKMKPTGVSLAVKDCLICTRHLNTACLLFKTLDAEAVDIDL